MINNKNKNNKSNKEKLASEQLSDYSDRSIDCAALLIDVHCCCLSSWGSTMIALIAS